MAIRRSIYRETTDEKNLPAVLLIREDGSVRLLRYWASQDGNVPERGGTVISVTVNGVTIYPNNH